MDPNSQTVLNDMDVERVNAALLKLKNAEGFNEYIGELKNLGEGIKTRVMNEALPADLPAYQACFALLESIIKITDDVTAEPINTEPEPDPNYVEPEPAEPAEQEQPAS